MLPIDPWPLVVPATMLGAFGVAVARSRGQWSVSLRLAGGARISRGVPRVCPHLGTTDDPFSHSESPSDEHRCYLYMQRSRIDVSHQKGFCLSTAHVACPWLQFRPETEPEPLRARAAAAGRRVVAVAGPAVRKGAAASVAAASIAATQTRRAARTGYRWAVEVAAPKTGAVALGELARASHTARFLGDLLADAFTLFGGVAGRIAGWLLEVLSAIAAWIARGLRWMAARIVMLLRRLRGALRQQAVAQSQRRAATLASRTPAADDAPAAGLAVALREATAPPRPVRPAPTPASPVLGERELGREAPRTQAADNLPLDAPAPVFTPLVRLGDNLAPPETAAAQFRNGRRAMELGLAAMEAGDEELAYSRFVAATEADPDNRRAWYWRAKTAPTLTEVVECLSIILKAEPENAQIRSSYEWALERLQAEHERERLTQREEAMPAAAPRPMVVVPRPNPLGVLVRGVARGSGAAACFILAALWLGAAALPFLSDGGRIALSPVLPFLPDLSALGAEFPELAPGYRLLAWTPHTLAFLALFTGLGLIQRQSWARTWSLIQALSYLLVVAARGYPGEGLALATALAAAVTAAVLANQVSPPSVPPSFLFTTTRNLGRG